MPYVGHRSMTRSTWLALIMAGAALSLLASAGATSADWTAPRFAQRDVSAAEPSLAQADGPAPAGLPPAPTYLPGTIITRDARANAAALAPRKERQREQPNREGARPAAVGTPGAAGELPAVLAAAGAPAVRTDHPVWRKLVPLLPEPGDFAVIPGSALRPHLVRKGEFPFCEDIKCYRSGAVLAAWNGGAFDAQRGQFRLHGGGHADYGGNEVYAFDFATLSWARETDPQPLTGRMLKDTDGDGVTDACPAPAAGPPATHTYQGFVHVPKIERYWLFGTVEYCSGAMGGQSAWEYDAERRTWTAMPELDPYAKFPRALIDPASGNVLVHVARKSGWHEIDPQSRTVVRSFKQDPFGSYIDGPAVFDSRQRVIYTIIGGRSTDRLVAYQLPGDTGAGDFGTRLVARWPKQGMKAWGIAQHASGLLVLWDGNDRILTVDPQSGQSWELQVGGAAYTSGRKDGRPARVYSKWAYIPEVDAFFGITSADLGIVLYRLGGAASPDSSRLPPSAAEAKETPEKEADVPVLPTGAAGAAAPSETSTDPALPAAPPTDNGWIVPLEIEAAASWEKVCNEAVLCDPIEDGEVLYRGRVVAAGPPQRGRGWRNASQKFNHPEAKEPTADPEIGGLRFAFPSRSGSGAAGSFSTNFSPDLSFQVGPAEAGAPAQEVFIQFQVRYSCTFIWTDCDPASANYRKERRCFLSKRGGGRCTASKIALISTGDRDGSTADACTRIQVAINHGKDHSLHGFHRCPRANGFGQRLPSTGGRHQSNSQPNGLYYCPRILAEGGLRRWNRSPDSCFMLVDDRWITIQVRLRFGPWQSDRKKGEAQLSHVSIWAGVEGQHGGRQRLVIDNDFYAVDPKGADLLGKIWLMPHLYNKTNTEDHPPFSVWYRNLVVSETLVPNPV